MSELRIRTSKHQSIILYMNILNERVDNLRGDLLPHDKRRLISEFDDGGLEAAARVLQKKLLQERGIPPWQRRRMPMLYCGEDLVCVPGIGEDCTWQAGPQEPGLIVTWEPFE